MLTIKVLGSGCPKCNMLEKNAVKALEMLAGESPSVEATIQHVRDINEIMKYPVLSTPALVVNEKVVCSGHVASPAQIKEWLEEALRSSAPSRTE